MKTKLLFATALAVAALAMPASAAFEPDKKVHARYTPMVADGMKAPAMQMARAMDQKPAETASLVPEMNFVSIGVAPMESVADLKKFDQIPTRGLVAKEKERWGGIVEIGTGSGDIMAKGTGGIPTEGIGTGSGDIVAGVIRLPASEKTMIGMSKTGDLGWPSPPIVAGTLDHPLAAAEKTMITMGQTRSVITGHSYTGAS